ncbi:hypothetical protein AAEX63_14380 [Luteococcus sp. H138]|uniref:hypothetical protein n=1 Tax=unclassified Luteococcus TaxID=2639923 RepID=UPI00313AF63C
MSYEGITLTGRTFTAHPVDSFPDLPSLCEAFDRAAMTRISWPGILDGEEVIVLDCAGERVLLGRELAAGAVNSLLGGPVVVRGAGVGRPIMLSSAGQPEHVVAIAPRSEN